MKSRKGTVVSFQVLRDTLGYFSLPQQTLQGVALDFNRRASHCEIEHILLPHYHSYVARQRACYNSAKVR